MHPSTADVDMESFQVHVSRGSGQMELAPLRSLYIILDLFDFQCIFLVQISSDQYLVL